MSNYCPSNDTQFDQWMANFIAALSTRLATFDMEEADLAPLEAADMAFGTALTSYLTKKAASISASAGKTTKREEVLDLLRPMVRHINNHPAMTNEIRGALGLPVREEIIHTMSTAGEEIPGIYLESAPGKVYVHFGTEPQNERINGKPSWARGCKIYRKKAGETDMISANQQLHVVG